MWSIRWLSQIVKRYSSKTFISLFISLSPILFSCFSFLPIYRFGWSSLLFFFLTPRTRKIRKKKKTSVFESINILDLGGKKGGLCSGIFFFSTRGMLWTPL
jgi:hypothetical protein